MDRIKIVLTTNEEGMKFHLNELFKEMAEHEEIESYMIFEEKDVSNECSKNGTF